MASEAALAWLQFATAWLRIKVCIIIVNNRISISIRKMLIGRWEVMWAVPPVQRELYVKRQGQLHGKGCQKQRQKEVNKEGHRRQQKEVHMHREAQKWMKREGHKE